MSFNFRNFLRNIVMRKIGNDPTHHVMEYAAYWHDKRVLTEDDMVEIEAAIEAYEESLLPPEPEEETEITDVTEEETEDAIE